MSFGADQAVELDSPAKAIVDAAKTPAASARLDRIRMAFPPRVAVFGIGVGQRQFTRLLRPDLFFRCGDFQFETLGH
jgi:hypothetical protein